MGHRPDNTPPIIDRSGIKWNTNLGKFIVRIEENTYTTKVLGEFTATDEDGDGIGWYLDMEPDEFDIEFSGRLTYTWRGRHLVMNVNRR